MCIYNIGYTECKTHTRCFSFSHEADVENKN